MLFCACGSGVSSDEWGGFWLCFGRWLLIGLFGFVACWAVCWFGLVVGFCIVLFDWFVMTVGGCLLFNSVACFNFFVFCFACCGYLLVFKLCLLV